MSSHGSFSSKGYAGRYFDWRTLHEAAESANLEMLKELLDEGADVNREDARGCTPLHLAIRSSNSDDASCVEALLAADADVCAVDPTGNTPLHVAAAKPASAEVLQLLLVARADLYATDLHGWSPLHHAAIRGHESSLAQLLQHEDGLAAALAVDANNSTPLHWAAMLGHEAFVARLLQEAAHTPLLTILLEARQGPEEERCKTRAELARRKTAAELAKKYGHRFVWERLNAFQSSLDSRCEPPSKQIPLPAKLTAKEWREIRFRDTHSLSPDCYFSRPRGFSREWPAKPKTEDEELSELKTLGIGMKSAMVVTKGLARLRAKAQANLAKKDVFSMPKKSRSAVVPRTRLEKAAMRTVVSFSESDELTVHAINDDWQALFVTSDHEALPGA